MSGKKFRPDEMVVATASLGMEFRKNVSATHFDRYHIKDEPALMLSDVVGRVNNTNLPKNKGLLPLFEAIINSLHAIEEYPGNGNGKIEVKILRDHQMHLHDAEEQFKTTNPIVGFCVTDNGIGFNSRHFESFKTADSRLKVNLGGKGIGRFIWLKAFAKVNISSTYIEDEGHFFRKFDFVLNDTPIQNYNSGTSKSNGNKTVVHLSGVKKAYQDLLPKKSSTIADKIIEHCLFYFLIDKCPIIILHDDDEASSLNLNELFKEKVKLYSRSESFKLKDNDFTIQYLALYFGDMTNHRFHLCANQRDVLDEPLHKYLPDLKAQKLADEEAQEFAFVAYVSGKYLDNNVNAERTDFNFAKHTENKDMDIFDLSKNELSREVISYIRKHLEANLAAIQKEKLKQFEKFAAEENPKYRPLLKYAKKELENIPAGLSNEKLDIEMYRALSSYEARLKEEGCRFVGKNAEISDDDPEFQEAYEKYIEKVTESGKARLAEYILHRRVILNLLEKSLQRQDDGKFSKEEKVHQILYPMRTTSEDNSFENQNLWIIDEKLAYHYYLASDLKISQMKPLELLSEKRPDILVFDKPAAFVEGEFPFYSVVIIELKKPEKKEYSEDKNPIQQVYDYIDILRGGQAEDKNKAVIRLNEKSRFYCYILANLTPQMVRFARSYRLEVTPDNMGYYGYNDNYNAYIEVIDYKKLLEDSKKRNRVLFDKLGLPH